MRITLMQMITEDGDVGTKPKAGQRGDVTRLGVHFQWLPP